MAKKSSSKAKDTTTTKKHVTKKGGVKHRSTQQAAAIEQPFFEFKVTQQTLYWVILGAAAITFALWLYTLDAKVRDLYDQLDANTYSTDIRPVAPKPDATEE